VCFIAEKLPELGYRPVEPVREGFWGAYIIDGNDSDDKEWGKIVGEELLKEAIEHNKKVREELEELNKQ
jgi:hypothetical protein